MRLETSTVKKDQYEAFEKFVRDGFQELKKVVERGEESQAGANKMLWELQIMLKNSLGGGQGHVGGD
jgi:deoxyhypusine synthase